MSSVGEGMGKSIGSLLIVGGLIAGAYLFRKQIADWIKGIIPNPAAAATEAASSHLDSQGGTFTDPHTGQDLPLSQYTSDDYKADLENAITAALAKLGINSSSGQTIDTTVPGTTPGEIPGVPIITVPPSDLCNWEPWKSSTACQSSREPITTPGYEEALGGVSNLVTGSAADAYANAQRIRELAAVPDYPSYASVMTLLGGESYKSYQVSPTQALGINRYGWDVHYTQDSGPWHEGQISAMNSGGSNPFGNKQFTRWLNMAESYGSVV